MSGLRDQFGSVDPNSLIGDDNEADVVEEEEVEVEPATEPDGDDQDPSKGRTIDNVYGELSRKQEKFQQEMMETMGNLV